MPKELPKQEHTWVDRCSIRLCGNDKLYLACFINNDGRIKKRLDASNQLKLRDDRVRRVKVVDWLHICEILGIIFALVAIVYSVYIMATVRRGASVWIYLGITSFCMFFAMLLGVIDLAFTVNRTLQRLEQFVFFLVSAIAFAMSGIKLYDMFVYKSSEG